MFSPRPRRRSRSIPGSLKHMLHAEWRFPPDNDMKKQRKSLRKRWRLIPIPTKRTAALFERGAEIRPDDYQVPCLLVAIYKSLGRPQDAQNAARKGVELAERELTLHPEDSRPPQIGSGAWFALGEKDRAREWTARALAIDPEDLVAQYNAACNYSLLGDVDAALDMLEQCLPKLGHEKVQWAKYDSDFDPLRDHPRYQKLFERIDKG